MRRSSRVRVSWWVLSLLATAAVAQDAAPSIGLDEIERGLRGYGLTVFSGQQAERFEVEVLGLMRNVSPDVSYILARLEGRGLEESGVIGGMSGSPVYFDGRLAGAVAFSWTFTDGAIAGITPIDAMRQLSTLPEGAARPASGEVVELAELAALELPEDLLERGLAELRPRLGGGAQGPVQFGLVGFGEPTQALLGRALGGVAPAGRAEPGAEVVLEPGSAVAGLLLDGDLMMTVSGTVTERTGEEILALGHSFLGVGPLRLPMASAEVVTVVSSLASSFKITNVGPVVGAFDQDRLAGLRGRLGLEAPTTPLGISVEGLAERRYDLRVARLPMMSPTLIAIAVLEAVSAASYAGGIQGLDLEARFRIAGHEELAVRQVFDGAGADFSTAIYLLGLVGYLVQNPLEEVQLEGVEIRIVQSAEPRSASLIGAHAERTKIRPGERVKLNLDLTAYRGKPFRHSLEITTPADLPSGRYYLFVGDGPSIDSARQLMEPASPVSFGQALATLRSFHSRQDLVVLGVHAGRGLVVAGEVMPRLPGSVRSLWQAASTMSATPLTLAVAQEVVETLDRPLRGAVRIDLEVERRQPRTGVAPLAGGDGPRVDGGEVAQSADSSASEAKPVGEDPG